MSNLNKEKSSKWPSGASLVFIAFFGLFVFFGIYSYFKKERVYEKEEIVAVYYHEGGRYSVMIERDNELVSRELPRELGTKIFTDIKDGESMWYELRYVSNYLNGLERGADNISHIHIRNVNDLKTADWNRGKFGRGKTTKVCCN